MGGCPSSMVISSTTFMYVVFATDSWILNLEGLNDVSVFSAIMIAVLTYVVVSLAKIHLGQNYPSDCILSLPPVLVVIGLFYLVQWVDGLTNLCPSCGDNDGFCYYESSEM